ncbi:Hypothetical predicted protein [Pelobates cultripes]|uniref:Uncharacterized protein n=1 Tax=Pelobates cultripes TaxID=61616 RepID=A0AAD1SQ86_PELCU|nr:Hypothetical predicted protein [Pelobates cultripes]
MYENRTSRVLIRTSGTLYIRFWRLNRRVTSYLTSPPIRACSERANSPLANCACAAPTRKQPPSRRHPCCSRNPGAGLGARKDIACTRNWRAREANVPVNERARAKTAHMRPRSYRTPGRLM